MIWKSWRAGTPMQGRKGPRPRSCRDAHRLRSRARGRLLTRILLGGGFVGAYVGAGGSVIFRDRRATAGRRPWPCPPTAASHRLSGRPCQRLATPWSPTSPARCLQVALYSWLYTCSVGVTGWIIRAAGGGTAVRVRRRRPDGSLAISLPETARGGRSLSAAVRRRQARHACLGLCLVHASLRGSWNKAWMLLS